jgi:phosphopantothenoylcysteine decarboxylase/phosphopantothenate--cysteine ligase
MEEPSVISAFCESLFQSEALSGKHVVITAGPTREAIDPVRYISNHSSGKMGFALATAALEMGAKVSLISGPVALQAPERVDVVHVQSAMQMHEAALSLAKDADLFIGAAAVSDYRVDAAADKKLKKDGSGKLVLELVENPDIIRDVAALPSRPYVVGFAAETHDLVDYAESKRQRKGLDMVIANDVSDSSIGFNSDNNAVTVLSNNDTLHFEPRAKSVLARDLLTLIAQKLV